MTMKNQSREGQNQKNDRKIIPPLVIIIVTITLIILIAAG